MLDPTSRLLSVTLPRFPEWNKITRHDYENTDYRSIGGSNGSNHSGAVYADASDLTKAASQSEPDAYGESAACYEPGILR